MKRVLITRALVLSFLKVQKDEWDNSLPYGWTFGLGIQNLQQRIRSWIKMLVLLTDEMFIRAPLTMRDCMKLGGNSSSFFHIAVFTWLVFCIHTFFEFVLAYRIRIRWQNLPPWIFSSFLSWSSYSGLKLNDSNISYLRECGSMPLVGSSRMTNDGLPRNAIATLNFRRCPPDNSPAWLSSFASRPTIKIFNLYNLLFLILSLSWALAFVYDLAQTFRAVNLCFKGDSYSLCTYCLCQHFASLNVLDIILTVTFWCCRIAWLFWVLV